MLLLIATCVLPFNFDIYLQMCDCKTVQASSPIINHLLLAGFDATHLIHSEFIYHRGGLLAVPMSFA